jgi:hypothetical protein
MFGYITHETKDAVAFFKAPLTAQMKPLWVPRKKIASLQEHDLFSVSIDTYGAKVRRMGRPVTIEVDAAFLEKVGAA